MCSLRSTSSASVIHKLKTVFARHGIPESLMSDNGPQFSSQEFSNFSKDYGFDQVTSSPNYPQTNGEAERAVRTIKTLLSKNDDPLLALLTYCSTPLQNGYSPAELLMGRKLRTTLPTISQTLQPKLPNKRTLQSKEDDMRNKQKANYNCRHRARNLEPLLPGETVWLPDRESSGTVVEESSPWSYTVQTPNGQFR